MQQAQAIAGLTIRGLAVKLDRPVPRDLRRHKGWLGELIETALGATSQSLPQPDFADLGIELKTIPVHKGGRPKESTHVCTVPLTDHVGLTWEMSLVKRKLQRVLWVPVQADAAIPLADRRIGTPILWSPTASQENTLRTDWEDLMELVCMGELDRLSAHQGEFLQIRPKAADGKALTQGIGASGESIQTLPRGFYLRPSFTENVLRQCYLMTT